MQLRKGNLSLIWSVWSFYNSMICWICLNILNMPDYAWICLTMDKYTGICVNIPKSPWMSFVLHFPIVIPCLLELLVVTYFFFNVCTKLEGLWGCFLEETKFNFLYSSWKYLICFSFQIKYFTSNITNLLLLLRAEVTGTPWRGPLKHKKHSFLTQKKQLFPLSY